LGISQSSESKNAEDYILVKESYTDSPNIFTTSDFKNQEKLSNTNPQQSLYNWGTSELVNWKLRKEIHLQAFSTNLKISIRTKNIR
jgi:hypothetical protein